MIFASFRPRPACAIFDRSLVPLLALLLQLSALPSSTVSAQSTTLPGSLDWSNIKPKSRLLTVSEFMRFLETETAKEFDFEDEWVAKTLNMTVEELNKDMEEVWSDASLFEYARAIRDGDPLTYIGDKEGESAWRPYPYLLCDETISETQRPESGFSRRARVEDAIRASAASANITMDEEMGLVTVYNGRDSWCAIANLNGLVAVDIEGPGMVVQPFVMAMKMAKGTVEILEAALEEYYDEVAEYLAAGDNMGTRRKMQEDGEQFPKIIFTLCESVITEEYFEELRNEGGEADWTDEMTDHVLERTDLGEEVTSWALANEIYWTNPDVKRLDVGTTSRGDFWAETVRLAFEGGDCVETFSTRMKWKLVTGDTYDAPQALVMEFVNTDAQAVDDFCVIGLLAGYAVKPNVCQVEIMPVPEIENSNAQFMTQTGVENETPFFRAGLDGTGQTVAVSDTGIDSKNCYFEDSIAGEPTTVESDARVVVQYVPFVNDNDYKYGHGTHVAGTIVGRREDVDDLNAIGNGVAPGAKVAFMDIGHDNGNLQLPSDTTLLSTGRSTSSNVPIAHIHSASWGSVGVNGYSYQARSFDNYMYDNDDFLIIVAAGNDGRYDVPNTVGSPGTAKNVVCVGASHSFGYDLARGMLGPAYVADFSSRGPTADGRMAPHLVAPGKYIVSAGARPDQPGACDEGTPNPGSGVGGLVSMAGTSMATPVTSGNAALIRQYFEEGWYERGEKNSGESVSPSGAMVKAVLMNGAQTNMKGVDNGSRGVTGVAPYDNTMGFGHVSLTHSLYIAGKTDVQIKFWDRETITYDGLRRFPVTIDKSNGCKWDQLSVTLVWTEKGSAANCMRCLLNDLDLYVTKDGDETKKYLPNGGSRDSINNAERVIIEKVSDGDSFTLNVDPYNLDTASQQFSLVATGCFGGIANTIDTSQNVYTADSSEQSQKNIIIISCSVVGGLIVLCVVVGCIRRRQRRK